MDNGDLSPTGAGNIHNRQPSFLTKEVHISRHERQKSAMGLESTEPSMITISDPDGHHSNLVSGGELILGKAAGGSNLTSTALGSVNEKQHNRRRIKSFLPGEYASNMSAASSTPLEENVASNNNLAIKNSRGNEQRTSAYQAI